LFRYLLDVLLYWTEILFKAFWDSFVLFYGSPGLLGIVIGATIVTGLLAWRWLGKAEFKSHGKGVLITAAGSVATWFLFFLVFLIKNPPDAHFLLQSSLKQSQQDERGAVLAREGALKQLDVTKGDLARLTAQGGRVPPVPNHCWFTTRAEEPNPRVEGALSASTVVILCNYRIEAPIVVGVQYDTKNLRSGVVLHMSESSTLGGGGIIKDDIFRGEITSPSLPAYEFLGVTMQGTTSVAPRALQIIVVTK